MAALAVLAGSTMGAGSAVAAAPGLPQVGGGARPGPDVLYAPAPRAPQLENVAPWTAPPILVSSGIAYRDGEWLYQDHLHDDRGAAGIPDPSDPHDVGTYLFSPKAGTLTYPTDPVFAHNAADLVELRVRPLAEATAYRVTLNTLRDPERVAFTIALADQDDRAARPWPHAAGVRSPARAFLTVHGTAAELRDARTGAVLAPAPTASVDLERRQVDVRLPYAAFDPRGRVVRHVVGVGLWDRAAGTYLASTGGAASAAAPGGGVPGGSRLFNVGPRVDEPFPDVTQFGAGVTIGDAAVGGMVDGAWWREKGQSESLALGDVSKYATEVDFRRLQARENDESQVPKTGPINRILASRMSFGQGIDHARQCFDIASSFAAGARCEGRMVGQLQPYGLYVPDRAAPRDGWGMTLLLHSLSANHNQYTASRNQSQLGERGAGTLVATPAGRGPDGFYAGAAEADTFEVWADVARHYRLDPSWAVVSGYSMGGFGTYRLLARWPDLFARGQSTVGAPGSVSDQLASLRNTPLMSWVAAADELVNIADTEQAVRDQTAAGIRFVHDLFPAADHLTLATSDEYGPAAAFLGEHRVDRDPPHVTYVVDPSEDNVGAAVVADHAYWLSGLRVRDPATAPTATVDARSLGFGVGDAPVLAVAASTGAVPGGSRGPMSFARRERAWGPAPAAPKADRLVVRATNLAAATVDARRARLSCAPVLDVTTDGPLDLRIACAPPPRCTKRRAFVVSLPRLRARGDRYVRVAVVVPGRRARTTRLRGGRRSARVDLGGRRAGRVRVTVSGRTAKGRTVRVVRTYRLC